ncbi:MAG: 2-hydroxyglutaryl-CoA dehydratase [Firmicutes bacterium]|nr:2-hydroxyglutaryl-CoA dehydratase [Bacillota bacterium]
MPKHGEFFLGIDVGSVSTNLIVTDADGEIYCKEYLRTQGRPIPAVQAGVAAIKRVLPDIQVSAVGTTGSGRHLAAAVVGADIVKNEITTHAVAATHFCPDVQTVIEIGGQDSKIIVLREGVVTDFAMNTVCAAGTGSFLDQQAARLGIPIAEFGEIALRAQNPVRIAGRCTVFAESDMIHKQQMGHDVSDILAGLCVAMVRNYLNNVGKGKDIRPIVFFQGGVAANRGMRKALEDELGCSVVIPPAYDVMGALGAALLAKDQNERSGQATNFRGFAISEANYTVGSFECLACANHCEIVNIHMDNEIVARWGSRCGRWDTREAGSMHPHSAS